MGSRDSWIDADELSALGQQLLGTPGGRLPAPVGGEVDGGSPPDAMLGRWKRQLAEIRTRAERSGLVGEAKPCGDARETGAVPEDFVPPPDRSLVVRMRAFEGWLAAAVGPRAAVGADDLGFPLFGAEGDPALVAAALSVCRSWHASGSKAMAAPSAMACSVLQDYGILSVFPLVEGEGFRFVAVVTGKPLGGETAGRVSSAFRAAMGGDPGA